MIPDKLGTELVSKFLDAQRGAEPLHESEQSNLADYLAQPNSIGRDFATAVTTIEGAIAKGMAASIWLNAVESGLFDQSADPVHRMDSESELNLLRGTSAEMFFPLFHLSSEAKSKIKQSIRDQIRNFSTTADSFTRERSLPIKFDLYVVAEASEDYEETNVRPIAESQEKIDDNEVQLLREIQFHLTQQWRCWLRFIENVSIGGSGDLAELQHWIRSQIADIVSEESESADAQKFSDLDWLRTMDFKLNTQNVDDIDIPTAPAFLATIRQSSPETYSIRLSFGIPMYEGDIETVLCEAFLDMNQMLAASHGAASRIRSPAVATPARTILCTDKKRRVLGRIPSENGMNEAEKSNIVLAPFELHDSSNMRVFLRFA